MNKVISLLAVAFALALSLCLFGCASGGASGASSASGGEAASSAAASSAAASASTEASAESSVAASASAALADGVYTVDVSTDSSMFHINEADEGHGTLTVADGAMTVHIHLASKKIVNLYMGTPEQAQADEAGALQPTTDEVTYADGMTEEVYGFDVPVPALDEPFVVSIIGTKGSWYEHKVTVSNPVSE